MMYILTEKEYNDLLEKQALGGLSKTKLQNLCTKIAMTMPVKWGWGGPDPKPWGCKADADEQGDDWCCDQCPVQQICPYEDKEYSK